MEIKKYFARTATSNVAHHVLQDTAGFQRLLCKPMGKTQPGIYIQKDKSEFVKECDRCRDELAKSVAYSLSHGSIANDKSILGDQEE